MQRTRARRLTSALAVLMEEETEKFPSLPFLPRARVPGGTNRDHQGSSSGGCSPQESKREPGWAELHPL